MPPVIIVTVSVYNSSHWNLVDLRIYFKHFVLFTCRYATEVFVVCRHSGLDTKQYRYYDPNTCGFDFKGAVDDILVSYELFDCFFSYLSMWWTKLATCQLFTAH